ncbi:hypothetical protein [Bosea sp. F3-2]|uniref:hypothetical protein n=1 Tax=Bosea sp. F3-2 TaxID=2599640 RepID=UPI0020C03426|nr:hypothetical protein [Bosea sp. F3-2]
MEDLADICGMSRSAFMAAFSEGGRSDASRILPSPQTNVIGYPSSLSEASFHRHEQ